PTRARVPDLHHVVVSDGGQPLTVRAEREGVQKTLVARKRAQDLAAGDVTDSHPGRTFYADVVETGRGGAGVGKPFVVRADGEVAGPLDAVQGAHPPTRGRVR